MDDASHQQASSSVSIASGFSRIGSGRKLNGGWDEKIGYLPLQTMGFAKLPVKKLTSQNCRFKHVHFDFFAIILI